MFSRHAQVRSAPLFAATVLAAPRRRRLLRHLSERIGGDADIAWLSLLAAPA